ncbi:MAG: hypothetical protein WC891_08860 [Actinomycetota bacterium]|jgi:hypothetical protein
MADEPVQVQSQDFWTMRAVVMALSAVLLIATIGLILSPILGITKASELPGIIQMIIGGMLVYINPLTVAALKK